MQIYLTRKLPDEILSLFPSNYHVQMYSSADTAVAREELLTEVKGASAVLSLVTERIDAEVMDCAGESLRIIANMAVGYDNIDVQAATERGIIVTNTPDVLTETTADLAFGLLLATARRIPEAERYIRSGKWETWSPMLLTGQEVFGKTIGIVGMGRIGQAVARRAAGFGMRIVYTSRKRKFAFEQSLPATYLSLEELLKTSDYVVPLTPATQETRHLISKHEFELMKSSAILVNISRGTVVDEDALIEALTEKRIYAAGLDVYRTEPLQTTSPLLHLENVVLLPHIGSASIQTRIRMARLAAQNIIEVLQGNKPVSPVNRI